MIRTNSKEDTNMGKNVWNRSFATAEQWGRNVNVPARVVERYLMELGYLDRSDGKPTALGEEHSVWANKGGQSKLLWDSETFRAIVKYRARMVEMREQCPECEVYLYEELGGL